jgi:hypothetical protein
MSKMNRMTIHSLHEQKNFTDRMHCKKRLAIFPFPAGMSLTQLSLVSGITAGDGKIANLFYSVEEYPGSILQYC